MKSFWVLGIIAFLMNCSPPNPGSQLKANSAEGRAHPYLRLKSSGNEVGNGGDVVICDNNGVKTYEVLDIYEARTKRQMNPVFEIGISDPFEMARSAIRRLENLDPKRMESYLNELQHFIDNHRLISEVDLSEIDDQGFYNIATNCMLKQLAIQKKPETPNDSYYLINKQYWDLLDATNQAGIILHEIVFNDAIHRGHRASTFARYFSSVLFSNETTKVDAGIYKNILTSAMLDGTVFSLKARESVFRVYDEQVFTLREAVDFCQSIPNTRVARKDDVQFYEIDFIDRYLPGKRPQTYFWINRKYFEDVNTAVFSNNLGNYLWRDEGLLQGVICETRSFNWFPNKAK